MKPTSRIRLPQRKLVRPPEDDREIGHRWKFGNGWSLVILIGRGLDFIARMRSIGQGRIFGSCAVVRVAAKRSKANLAAGQREAKLRELNGGRKGRLFSNRIAESGGRAANRRKRSPFPVVMTKGIHLFPYRTQKLSPSVPMVLGWRRPGRVGRCRIPISPVSSDRLFLFLDVIFEIQV